MLKSFFVRSEELYSPQDEPKGRAFGIRTMVGNDAVMKNFKNYL